MKRIGLLACMFVAAVLFPSSFAFASDGITLLMVPREDGPVRLGMDVGSRHPTLLLSYKVLPDGSASLHGWSGTEWVNVTSDSFAEGSFFHKQPESAVVVWDEPEQLPKSLIPKESWCPTAYQISTTEMRPLLHLLGRHYDFKYDDWRWFSDNYRLPFNSINPDGLNVSWYHRRLGENLKQGKSTGTADLEYFTILYGPQPVLQDEPDALVGEAVETTESPAGEEVVEGTDNPLTNAVPQAVILGAGEASETAVEEQSDKTAEKPADTVDEDGTPDKQE